MRIRMSGCGFRKKILFAALPLATLVFALPASGQVADARTKTVPAYALLIGSNRPGPKQSPLRYTHDDARRLKQVLEEIGGYSERDITLLEDPTPKQLVEALEDLTHRIAGHAAKEEQTSLVFYYSGHARSNGLNLGSEDFPLTTLRSELEEIPATVKVILLDACQAGAYSRVKGVMSDVSFSINSVDILQTEGTAVIASSGESELSQESDSLRGSFFTHHLVAGLRGAADKNSDGRVTLFEAYGYAYNQTLLATSETKVGKQHVTLETNLTGKGEMVLTWPAEASSSIVLKKELDGELLIYQVKNQVVLAEIQKAAGSDLRLAFPPGEYGVLLKQGQELNRCPITLRENVQEELNPASCVPVDTDDTLVKFSSFSDDKDEIEEEEDSDPFAWRFFVEGFFGGQIGFDDAYTDRLHQFGYGQSADAERWPYYSALIGLNINRSFSFGLLFSSLDRQKWKLADSRFDEPGYPGYPTIDDRSTIIKDAYYEVSWYAYRIAPFFRFSWPLFDQRFIPYLQIGAGLTIGELESEENHYAYASPFLGAVGREGSTLPETYTGFSFSISLGASYMFYEWLGVVFQAEAVFAPAIRNYFGDWHNSGGVALVGGCRFNL